MTTNPTTYQLTLKAIPGDDRPAAVRLRQLLKHAIRSCGLRCTAAEEIKPEATTTTSDTKGPAERRG